MPITFKHADMATVKADLLVNPVNTQGVAGKGVALAIKDRYPEFLPGYQAACAEGRLLPGLVQLQRMKDGTRLLNVATKAEWAAPTQPHWAGAGLYFLGQVLKSQSIDVSSVAMPLLGCGNGGLAFETITRALERYLAPASGRGIEIQVVSEPKVAKVAHPIRFAGVGARSTPPQILRKMAEFGMAAASDDWILRSGGAAGADRAFEGGAGPKASEIFTARDAISPIHNRTVSAFHPAPDRLDDYAFKLMARNSAILFGSDFCSPVDVVLAWTPNGKVVGGTGLTLRLAESIGIPVINLAAPEYADLNSWDLYDKATEAAERYRADVCLDVLKPKPKADPAPAKAQEHLLQPALF